MDPYTDRYTDPCLKPPPLYQGLGNETISSNIPHDAVLGIYINGTLTLILTSILTLTLTLGSTDVSTTIGFHSLILVGRTHQYTGSFFAGISEGTYTHTYIYTHTVT